MKGLILLKDNREIEKEYYCVFRFIYETQVTPNPSFKRNT